MGLIERNKKVRSTDLLLRWISVAEIRGKVDSPIRAKAYIQMNAFGERVSNAALKNKQYSDQVGKYVEERSQWHEPA
ncbi:MAG: hypothetical protein KJ950_05700 [Proteobacteria bacterium]|nr:hypothetical protein [Pseudomonadota bacterium]MBU1687407.1 hypothetical protein [Pseudomonadota bacterium]